MIKMDGNKIRTYLKEQLLGKGGFAYCMQVIDLDDQEVCLLKVILAIGLILFIIYLNLTVLFITLFLA